MTVVMRKSSADEVVFVESMTTLDLSDLSASEVGAWALARENAAMYVEGAIDFGGLVGMSGHHVKVFTASWAWHAVRGTGAGSLREELARFISGKFEF